MGDTPSGEREVSDTARNAADAARSWVDLGTAVRQAMNDQGWAFRPLADTVHSSRSTLQRMTRGSGWTSPALVRALDRVLGFEGRLVQGTIRLRAEPAEPGSEWMHHFPESHVGRVWMRLVPKAEDRYREHLLKVRWGPWELRLRVAPPVRPTVWWFGKGDDGLSVPLFVFVEPAARLEFAIGCVWEDEALDANVGWIRWQTQQ